MGEQCDDFFGREGGMRRPTEVYKLSEVSSLVSGIIDFDRSNLKLIRLLILLLSQSCRHRMSLRASFDQSSSRRSACT